MLWERRMTLLDELGVTVEGVAKQDGELLYG
jgi:hypothetical protein